MQIIEAYLRSFVNQNQDNWKSLIPTMEFAYNSAPHSSTGMSPFYANRGYHPASQYPSSDHPKNPASRLYVHWMKGIHEEAREALQEARERMKKYANKRRRNAPDYTEGQLVMLNAKNVKTKRPSKKLDRKMLGPFRVEKVVSPTALRLQLPPQWRIHPVFHVSLIEPFRHSDDRDIDQNRIFREVGDVEPEVYNVDKILDSVWDQGRVKYLVKWEGWPSRKDWTWEPLEHFPEETRHLLFDFHRRKPNKPRDPGLGDPGGA